MENRRLREPLALGALTPWTMAKFHEMGDTARSRMHDGVTT